MEEGGGMILTMHGVKKIVLGKIVERGPQYGLNTYYTQHMSIQGKNGEEIELELFSEDNKQWEVVDAGSSGVLDRTDTRPGVGK